ncbi:MAG: hypothetical protein ACLQBY_09165 [Solirubrobacteraceae bacterium]
MSSSIPIPGVVTPRLREGAKSLTRALGCNLQDAADDPPAFGELHERLRSVWGLLDVIGWGDADDHGEIEVDLGAHSAALLAALDEILPTLAEWLAEMADDDADKPSRADEYRLVRQFEAVARRAITNAERDR